MSPYDFSPNLNWLPCNDFLFWLMIEKICQATSILVMTYAVQKNSSNKITKSKINLNHMIKFQQIFDVSLHLFIIEDNHLFTPQSLTIKSYWICGWYWLGNYLCINMDNSLMHIFIFNLQKLENLILYIWIINFLFIKKSYSGLRLHFKLEAAYLVKPRDYLPLCNLFFLKLNYVEIVLEIWITSTQIWTNLKPPHRTKNQF